MFSSVGWGEVLVLLVVGLLVIGPERLPGLIKEVRAVLLAFRNAVSEARAQLDGEFGEEMKQFSKPLAELNSVRQMGAKGFLTKTLLDGDDSFLESMGSTTQQVKDTVDSVRKPDLREALRGRGQTAPHSPQAAASGSESGGVPVTQQSAVGESHEQGSAVKRAAENMVASSEASEAHKQPHSQPQPSGDAQSQSQPQPAINNLWDDVL
ncbi:Sec-independent protein translocase TatB [Corynebacterium sp. 4HC-13]|uniref:twin-arginine translocase TatA/TatE family subunit n=1 Tax=Corynebacterium anserum TaxID=2684406 RepID=UPI001639716D|nr:twin-arginine translocase TatA/TatE family subunit [Corynebacterium anserum]MBC2681918.1 Sec-independent protein translocase TatB [Corynebacterium anserum]